MDELEKSIRQFFLSPKNRKQAGITEMPPKLFPIIKKVIDESRKQDLGISGDKPLMIQAQEILEERISNFAVQLMDILIQQFKSEMNKEMSRVLQILEKNYNAENGVSQEAIDMINKEL